MWAACLAACAATPKKQSLIALNRGAPIDGDRHRFDPAAHAIQITHERCDADPLPRGDLRPNVDFAQCLVSERLLTAARHVLDRFVVLVSLIYH